MSQGAEWPPGTSTTASSTHADNFAIDCACNRSYNAMNVLDGNAVTFWNDDTSNVWPDTIALAVAAGKEVNLTGLSIISQPDGFIIDFDVKLLHRQVWTLTHQVRGVSTPQTDLDFSGLSNITDTNGVIREVGAVSIDILNSQNEFSRVAEIRPVLEEPQKSSATLSSPASSTPASLSTITTIQPPVADTSTKVSTSVVFATATTTASSVTIVSASASASTTSNPADNLSLNSHQNQNLVIGVSVMATVIALLAAASIAWCYKRRSRKALLQEAVHAVASGSSDGRQDMYKPPLVEQHSHSCLPEYVPKADLEFAVVEMPARPCSKKHEIKFERYHTSVHELAGRGVSLGRAPYDSHPR